MTINYHNYFCSVKNLFNFKNRLCRLKLLAIQIKVHNQYEEVWILCLQQKQTCRNIIFFFFKNWHRQLICMHTCVWDIYYKKYGGIDDCGFFKTLNVYPPSIRIPENATTNHIREVVFHYEPANNFLNFFHQPFFFFNFIHYFPHFFSSSLLD